MVKKPFVIGISGGSGSGKTTVTELFAQYLGEDRALVMNQDHYYHDLSHMSPTERKKENFDAPNSINSDLLIKQMTLLSEGKSIERPVYNFVSSTRLTQTEKIEPQPVILLEGIFTLFYEKLLPLIDLKIFVDVPNDLRFLRRLDRDIRSRGRSLDCVIQQYLKTVRPMHEKYVEPCKRKADFVIPWTDHNPLLVKAVANIVHL